MYKKISYVIFFLIIASVGLFVFVNNQKIKNSPEVSERSVSDISEEERLQIIFSEQFETKKLE